MGEVKSMDLDYDYGLFSAVPPKSYINASVFRWVWVAFTFSSFPFAI